MHNKKVRVHTVFLLAAGFFLSRDGSSGETQDMWDELLNFKERISKTNDTNLGLLLEKRSASPRLDPRLCYLEAQIVLWAGNWT